MVRADKFVSCMLCELTRGINRLDLKMAQDNNSIMKQQKHNYLGQIEKGTITRNKDLTYDTHA